MLASGVERAIDGDYHMGFTILMGILLSRAGAVKAGLVRARTSIG